MPPRKKITEEEKKRRRREQKKQSMRRARARLNDAAIEERRRKDRERYHKKKEEGLVKTIDQYTPRQQRQIRKMWRDKARKRREDMKQKEELTNCSTPTTCVSSYSRVASGTAVIARNKRKLKAENLYLKERLTILESKLTKYKMRLRRATKKICNNSKQVTTFANKSKESSIKNKIHDFLQEDEYSRLTSGKKETITRNKKKKQIRLLNDSLLNLHKIFMSKTGIKLSYQTFRRNRPFWVIFPKVLSRDTCLCSVHTNNNLIVHALRNSKIILQNTATEVAKSLCCDNVLRVNCLERKCQICSEKNLQLNNFNKNDSISYSRWITKTVTTVVKGHEKTCKKTIKETVSTKNQVLVNLLFSNIPIFMQHCANIINQSKAIRFIKENLTPSDGLLHIDFSENYMCKYAAEIQSAHFGGSKPQISLHTSVYYYTHSDPPNNLVKPISMCTLSENLRHDPVLICAHLKPILQKIKELSPNITHFHILSDGPTTQYRNKTMFYLIVNYLSKILNVETITWHYSEAGHGKGAPDGVGGCIKRSCDQSVAAGSDISDFNALLTCVKSKCKGIEAIGIDDSNVAEIEEIAASNTIRPFKGTLKIHQICWAKKQPNILHARRLSCIICAAHAKCSHYEIGQLEVETDLLRSPSKEPSCRSSTPISFASNHSSLASRHVPTPDASTVSFRSYLLSPTTPEDTPSQAYPSRPYKRLRLLSDSDDSDTILSPQNVKKIFVNHTDSEDEDDFIIHPQQHKKSFINPYTDSEDDESIF